MKHIRIETTTMACLGLLLLGGCTYGDTDLYNRQRGRVRIALDWGGAAVPDSAAFYFYPSGQDIPQVRMSAGDGFEGTLDAGTYRVMVTNTGYSRMHLRTTEGYDRALACADAVAGRGMRAAEPALLESPQNIYGTGITDVEVGVENVVRIAYPQPLAYTVRLDVLVEGPIAVSRIEGTLSGVSSAVHIPAGKPVFADDAAILFPLEKQGEGLFSASATTFGLRPGTQGDGDALPNRLCLQVELPDQTVFTSELDITALVEEAVGNVSGGTVTATIELKLTVDPSNPGGFNLQLVGWHTGTGSAGEEE